MKIFLRTATLVLVLAAAALAQQVPDAATLLTHARTQLNNQQPEDAEQTLLLVLSEYPDSPLAKDAKMELSRVYERMNRPEDAAAVLFELYRSEPEGPFAQQALIQRARVLQSARLNEQALDAYRLIAANYPDTSQAVNAAFQASSILRALGRIDEAADALDPVLNSAKPNERMNARRQLVDIYFQAKRFRDAEREAKIVLEDESENVYIMERLATIYESMDSPMKAAAMYEQLMEKRPGLYHYENKLFAILQEQDLLEERIEELDHAARRNPEDLAPVHMLVRIYLWQNRSLDALRELEIIVEAEPGNLNDAVLLARLYYENQWKNKAREILDRVLQIDPKFTPALQQLGDMLYAEGEKEQAIEAWKKAVNFIPGDRNAYVRLGSYVQSKQMYGEAARVYEQGRADLGDDNQFTGELMFLYRMQMRYRDALVEYLRQISNGQPVTSINQEMLTLALGEELVRETPGILEEWLKRAPDARPLRRFLTEFYAATDNFEPALAELGRFASLHPGDPDMFLEMASGLMDSGRYAHAGILFEKAVGRLATPAQRSAALMGAARAFLWNGDTSAAQSDLERLTREFPDAAEIPEALFRLAQLHAAASDCDAAMDYFNRLAQQFPGGAYASRSAMGRARCLISTGAFTDAETALNELAKAGGVDVRHDEIDFLKGEARFLRGMFDQAEPYYRKIVNPPAADPGAPPQDTVLNSRFVNDSLERLLFINTAALVDRIQLQVYMEAVRARASGDMARAAELFEGLILTLEATPLADHARLELARTQREQGRAAEAADMFLALADSKPDQELFALALLDAGDTLQQLGRSDDAFRAYQRIIDEAPSSFWAHQAREKVGALLPAIQPES